MYVLTRYFNFPQSIMFCYILVISSCQSCPIHIQQHWGLRKIVQIRQVLQKQSSWMNAVVFALNTCLNCNTFFIIAFCVENKNIYMCQNIFRLQIVKLVLYMKCKYRNILTHNVMTTMILHHETYSIFNTGHIRYNTG